MYMMQACIHKKLTKQQYSTQTMKNIQRSKKMHFFCYLPILLCMLTKGHTGGSWLARISLVGISSARNFKNSPFLG